jgi:hypothetical protein
MKENTIHEITRRHFVFIRVISWIVFSAHTLAELNFKTPVTNAPVA